MDDKQKKILIIGTVCGILFLTLLYLVLHTILVGNVPTDSAGLLKGDAVSQEPELISPEDRDEVSEKKDPMPVEVQESLDMIIRRGLSAGNFEALDKQLGDIAIRYKDSTGDADDEMAKIDAYRADLAFYQSVSKPEMQTLSVWTFKYPDVLASAVAFGRISDKYLAFIQRDSAATAPSLGDIYLREAELTTDEQREKLAAINLKRTDEAAFERIKIYNMSLNETWYEFIAVFDTERMCWEPYSLLPVEDDGTYLTVRALEEMLAADPTLNLDSVISAPAAMSEYPFDSNAPTNQIVQ